MIPSRLPVKFLVSGTKSLLVAASVTLVVALTSCSNKESPADATVSPESEAAASAQAADVQTAPLNKPQGQATQTTGSKEGNSADSYKTIEWTDLIPQDDLDALLSPPEYLDEIEDGSEDDQLNSQIQNTVAEGSGDRYQQALASKRIIAEYHNQKIRIAGFIVPLEFDDELTVTEFFLVPYFGACIHLPPPPPNQVIHVTFAEGLQVQELYDPFWISGTLQTSIVENDTATAAYTLQAVNIEPYED